MQDLDVASIKDCEDPAVGAGILSQNAALFDDKSQVSMAPPSRVDSAGLNRRVCKTKFGLLNHKCDQNETFRGAK